MNDEKKIRVVGANYIASAVSRAQYPEPYLQEITLMGRSNVGKSSLINSLCQRRGLARISGTPGKTQTLNFYQVTVKVENIEETIVKPKEEIRENFYLVDLPGYGYAKVSQKSRKIWAKFIEDYLLHSPQLRVALQLVDIRHDLMASDIERYQWLIANKVPMRIIATKADKISRNMQAKQLQQIRKTLNIPAEMVIPFSSVEGTGREEILRLLQTVLGY